MESRPLIRALDSIQLPVPNLESAVDFYGAQLGHRVVWRSATAVGLRLGDSEAELVVHVERREAETDLLVDDVAAALQTWISSGGTVDVEPFDIPIGRCAVVRDPFGNRLVLLDSTRGLVFLETDRLVMRRFTDDDAGRLVELDSDPEAIRYVTRLPTTHAEAAERVRRFQDDYRRYRGYGYWAAIEKETGDFIGWFHLMPGERNHRDDEPELGYRLRRAAWGKGYATEGSRALIDRAFGDLGARRVWAQTMAVNTASRRVMEKAGMRYVRTVQTTWPERLPGDEHGDVEYAISYEEWEADRARD